VSQSLAQKLSLAVFLLLLTACGAARPTPTTNPMSFEDQEGQLAELRDEQLQTLIAFETHLSAAGDHCPALCEHHTRICELATRICAIADTHKAHARAADACKKANHICGDVTRRLPQDCYCR